MGAFEYSALTASGDLKKGVLEGDTARQVRQNLRERGLVPVTVEAITRSAESGNSFLWKRQRLRVTDLALVTRQLATLVRSGTVLEEALKAVAEQAEKANCKRVLASVRSKVLEGHTLASALADFPAIFSDLYRATVEAGEQAGHLDVVFERLAEYTEFRHQVQQKILLALLYPVLLCVVALLIVIALLAYVVPQVIKVFENIGQTLPLLTKLLIATSNVFNDYWLIMFVGIVVLVLSARWLFGQAVFKETVQRFLLRMPLVSRIIKTSNAARFARSLSILTASGVSVVDGLQLSAKVLSNIPMKRAVEEASRRVREGESLHRTLAKCGYFPPLTIHLIASGEASARLEEMLDRAAVAQEKEVEMLLAAALGIFEPVLILLMGGVVLSIVMAILLPIMDLNQLVK